VQISDSWRYVESAGPEHRYDVHVLHPVLYLDDTEGKQFGDRGSTPRLVQLAAKFTF
jgi:hypothetical protein